jgi:hypothetical protein
MISTRAYFLAVAVGAVIQANPAASFAQGVRFHDSGQRLGSGDSYCAALADVDRDGDIDAFVTNADRSSAVWLNDGTGRFTDADQDLGSGTCVVLGDLDGDSDDDAFVTGDTNRVLLNDGGGRFFGTGQALGDVGAEGVSLGDLDGDGDLDAFVANNTWQGGNGANTVWLNQER